MPKVPAARRTTSRRAPCSKRPPRKTTPRRWIGWARSCSPDAADRRTPRPPRTITREPQRSATKTPRPRSSAWNVPWSSKTGAAIISAISASSGGGWAISPLRLHRAIAVDRIDPQHGFRLLHRLDVEIDGDGLAVAAHQHAFQHLIRAGIDLLMRHVRRDEDEIARIGLGGELQMLAPAHARLAAHHIDDALEMAVMMRAGFGIGLDRHRAGPQFLRAGAGKIDRGFAIHAGRRRHIGIELIARNDAHAVVLPTARIFGMAMRMVVSLGHEFNLCRSRPSRQSLAAIHTAAERLYPSRLLHCNVSRGLSGSGHHGL